MRLAPTFPLADVHAQRQTNHSQWLFHHLLVKITFVIREPNLLMKTEYILMILSGMAMAVVQEAAAASSTLHHGSASNSPNLPLMILNSGCAVIRALKMKMFWLIWLSFMCSKYIANMLIHTHYMLVHLLTILNCMCSLHLKSFLTCFATNNAWSSNLPSMQTAAFLW